jgi:lipoprotein-anchoring transpeptidase ErfK/SrfK
VTSSQKPEDHVRSSLRRGLAAARAGDQTEARRWLQVALETDPDNITALLWLAWLAPTQRESLSLLGRALELDPKNERAREAIRWARRRPSVRTLRADTDANRPEGEALSPVTGLPGRADRLDDALSSPEAREQARTGVAAHCARRLIGPLGLLLAVAACLFVIGVALTAWYSPSAVLAWMLPTATPIPSPLPTLPLNSVDSPTDSIVSVPTSAYTPDPLPIATPTVAPNPTATIPPTLPTATPAPAPASDHPANGEKWIDVDLTHQLLTAFQGNTPVFQTSVSTGLGNTPTVVGQFRIYWKLAATDMAGPGYYLPDVPYTMYFHAGYAVHGTYWHDSFGQPMSHGCVNLRTEDAKWLFNWADPSLPAGARQARSSDANPGTLVVVHR